MRSMVPLERPRLLAEVFPEVANGLVEGLRAEGMPLLAATVNSLEVFGRCGCGASFCLSLFTLRQANRKTETVPLLHDGFCPDYVRVVDGEITYLDITWGDACSAKSLKQRFETFFPDYWPATQYKLRSAR